MQPAGCLRLVAAAAVHPPRMRTTLYNAGASGDLAGKKTYPALQFLFSNG